MSAWTTRPRAFPRPSEAGLAPSLLFHKWHAYDLSNGRRTTDVKDSRMSLLESVAGAVKRVMTGPGEPYSAWHLRYSAALRSLGVAEVGGPGEPRTLLAAPTVWRLVVGFGTNPALETGLQLHSLLGFPYVPGSSVRGFVHSVAEVELMVGRASWPQENVATLFAQEGSAVEAFLQECELVWALFGSLNLERHLQKNGSEGKELPAGDANETQAPTARDLLEHWRSALKQPAREEQDPRLKRIVRLLDETTGGRLVFYDAVPKPGQDELLQVDILNPHYPDWQKGEQPPSDDQNPNPINFLAVAPEKIFEFRFRWRPFRGDPPTGSPERAKGLESARRWLKEGLESVGVGGKTAAGYGYFDVSGLGEPPPVARAGEGEDRATD